VGIADGEVDRPLEGGEADEVPMANEVGFNTVLSFKDGRIGVGREGERED